MASFDIRGEKKLFDKYQAYDFDFILYQNAKIAISLSSLNNQELISTTKNPLNFGKLRATKLWVHNVRPSNSLFDRFR